MTTTYTIKSIKGSETVKGTAADAVRAALTHDAEYQPAFGTTIEVRDSEVLDLRDADELISTLRDEAEEHGDGAQVALCERAAADDESRITCLAQILDTHVEAMA